MHDGSLQKNIFNIKNDKLPNAGGIIGRIEEGGKEEGEGRGRGRRKRREGKGKIGRGYNYVFTHLFFTRDISHSLNGFYGLFLIS